MTMNDDIVQISDNYDAGDILNSTSMPLSAMMTDEQKHNNYSNVLPTVRSEKSAYFQKTSSDETNSSNAIMTLDSIFAKLKKDKNNEVDATALYLETFLFSLIREVSIEEFQNYSNHICNKVLELINSKNPREQMAGIMTIDKLVNLYSQIEELPNLTSRLTNYLRILIPSDDESVMRLAANTLGKLAGPSGTMASDFVETQVKICLEWLSSGNEQTTFKSRQEGKRIAAILLLSSLSKYSPYIIYPHVNSILKGAHKMLNNHKASVRRDTAEVIHNCLNIIQKRDKTLLFDWYDKILDLCSNEINIGTNESIHSSMLLYKELLSLDNNYLMDSYDEIFQTVWNFRNNRLDLTRFEIYHIISLFAAYNPQLFASVYLNQVILDYLSKLQEMRTNKKGKFEEDRPHILRSLGDVSAVVETDVYPYVLSIVDAFSEELRSKYQVRQKYEPEIFYGIVKLTGTIGLDMTSYLQDGLLDLIFECPLSSYMAETLKTIVSTIPSLELEINSRLLNLISLTLSGRDFRIPGSPIPVERFSKRAARQWRDNNELQHNGRVNTEKNDCASLTQALTMLQSIKCPYSLIEFVQHCTIFYIEHNDNKVRELAAVTSCGLFVNDGICKQVSINALNTVSEILSKLLTVAITDTVPKIRLEILRHLNQNTDAQLAQPSNVKLLFTALNDEIFGIRVEAINILGRLTAVNPAYIIPSLRKILLELLTELKYLKTSRKNEESLTLLCSLISSTKGTCKPYLEPILQTLLVKARDKSGAVSTIAMKAIGELAVVSGEEIKQYLLDVIPLIIDTFQDQSNSFKRLAALKAFSQISSSSGYVIDPLLDYPPLLNVLINILKSDSAQNIKRETVHLLGVIGALDPYKHREVEETSSSSASIEQNAPPIDIALLMQNSSPSADEYYPTVVITVLLKILKDPSLTAHHTAVIQTLIHIYQTLGLNCVAFLPHIIPAFLSAIKVSPQSLLDFYFQKLDILIDIVKLHIRPFAADIYKVLLEFLPVVKLQFTIISVIESISDALEGEFKPFIPETLTCFLTILEEDKAPNKQVSKKVLNSLVTFGETLNDSFYLILPMIIRMTEFSTLELRIESIITIGKLSRYIKLSDISARLIQTSIRLLNSKNPLIIDATMNMLCLLLLQMRSDYMIYITCINNVLIKNNIVHKTYDQMVSKLLKKEDFPKTLIWNDKSEKPSSNSISKPTTPEKLPINQNVLKSTWDCTQQRTREDWQEWIRRLAIQLLKESPSHALRACAGLASVYYPLAKDLFNVSFVSIWTELYTQYQEDFIKCFCVALSSPQNPPEIHQVLLNLVEFMEHDEKSLPIPLQSLGEYAERSHAYAKALHFKETKFIQEPIDNSIVESLISINNQLHQNDAAVGILKYVQKHHNLQLQETWYEKLERWEDALQAYTVRAANGEESDQVIMGQMRSFHALSDWDSLSKLASHKWDSASINLKKMIAPLAAGSEWGLGHWDKIEQYINAMKPMSPDREFFSAVLCLHNNNFDDAETHIFNARNLLVTEISALISESYTRAYNVVVRSQLITELEEIIAYKTAAPNSEKRLLLKDTWNKRLIGCQRNVDVWQRVLKVRSLVIKPKQDMQMWIKFANLCRKSGKLNLAEKALNSLSDDVSETPTIPSKAAPSVVYAQLKFLWANDSKQEALRYLIGFTSRMAHDLGLDPSNMIAQTINSNSASTTPYVEDYTKLLARCFLKQGEWRVALQPNWRIENPDAILGSYLLATHFDGKWYKAWHNWALANFEVISAINLKRKNAEQSLQADRSSEHESQNNPDTTTMNSEELLQRHVVPAIKGFFHSIALSSSLQDTLRLLTLWFTFGGAPEAAQAITNGFNMIKIDNWLEVLPQLISRIHQPDQTVSKALLSLLTDLGRAHPQVLLNPLIVAIKSESVSRKLAALSIIEKMKMHSPILVEQAELVSDELIRVAVLWHELWYEGLEDASRQFFGEHNTEKMFLTLEPLHDLLKRDPETLRESNFQNSFGRDLNDAYEWVLNYKRTNDITNLNQAWDIYYNVFRRISRQLPQLQTLELQHVSPKLQAAHDLDIAVFGTYQVGKPVIKIKYFDPIFVVISSKQRPRKFSVKGSDGKEYQYLLKGHEDIRQDSLVMQLFGLVNTLLENDSECFQRHLDIQRYPAIPLSPKSGLLGWVPNSDTFHVLIREHRDANKVPLNIEHWVMLQMAPDYDNLTWLQKIEVFQYAMENTKGQDLAQILWLKSRSSESWLDRRTVYTRSLAVMSMVGYILGLGDRHPSNLMLDRITGKVIHIDFGDCFEAAILREKFPEKVPFRLTRMIVNAMEVSGVEGSFRITCENVMRVLRGNKESLMAILEAFAFDPLIRWGFDLPTEKIIQETGIQIPLTNPSELLRKGAITAADASKMETEQQVEIRNARAVLVLRRITNKLTGNDITKFQELSVNDQVDKLIREATSIENLCQHYVGWCPFW
ncbi:phosphatidylinositol kinase-related protein kinase [Maudiozyma humilis]|uniref:Serine/threonine-protein kinase TOR n=1 Tax=Maudiozyma humilis TaxID=51915 RepID=A0AAV5RUI8_MAUHU|nr:phosphatidylinositol kinase-related protein kinase [Kazachstania humilis]